MLTSLRRITGGIRGRRAMRAVAAIALLALAASAVAALASQEIPPAGDLPGKIVYTRASDNPSAFAIDIFVANGNGDNEQQLTNTVDSDVYGSARGEDQPRWSPDGSDVAFYTADRDGIVSIWVVAAVGGTPTPMVAGDGEGGDPAWLRDGACIVYAGAHSGGESTLDVKRACRDGSGSTLTDTDDVDERGPDVSPDGTTIVYQARRPPESVSDRSQWSLRLVDVDGGNDRLLYAPSQGSATNPRWSPDGTRIAFVAGIPEGIGALAVLTVATGVVEELAMTAGGPLSWSPDGSQIVFYNTSASGPRTIGTVRLDGTALAQEPQLLGLYVYDGGTRALMRLRGAAGGAAAGADSYKWGVAPDWWGPSPTPGATEEATATPTTETTETPGATATASPTPSEAPPPAGTATVTATDQPEITPTVTLWPSPTATVQPSDTPQAGARIHLPIAQKPPS